MSKFLRAGLVSLIAAAFLLTSVPFALAKPPGGQGGGPFSSGFTKGEKKGWGDSETPKGWTKGKGKGKHKKWDESGTPPGLDAKTTDATEATE